LKRPGENTINPLKRFAEGVIMACYAKKDKIIFRIQKEKPKDKTWELRPIFGDLMWPFDKWNIL